MRNNKMNNKNIEICYKDEIAILKVSRPSKQNSLNNETLVELYDTIKLLIDNKNIHGVILSGSGEKSFIAGADIEEFLEFNVSKGYEMSCGGHRLLKLIEDAPKPFIAAINGYALGGGCEIAMACHLRIATPNAIFGQPEVKLGIIPGFAGTQRLLQYLGKSKALELMLTGDFISAEDALKLHLINYIVDSNNLIKFSIDLIKRISRNSPIAIEKIIKCVNAYFDPNIDGFEFEQKEFADCFSSNDFVEGVNAFINKKNPNFR